MADTIPTKALVHGSEIDNIHYKMTMALLTEKKFERINNVIANNIIQLLKIDDKENIHFTH